MTKSKAVLAAIAIAALSLPLSGQSKAQRKDWRDYAAGPDGSRFVTLDQITKGNVDQLSEENS